MFWRRNVSAFSLATLVLASTPAFGQPAQTPAAAVGSGKSSLQGLASATNGSLVIPVRDASGQVRDALVLLPVQARTARPTPSPVVDSASATGHVGGGLVPLTNTWPNAPLAAQKVVEIQVALARRGWSPGSVDGLMGPQTRAALKAFQLRENLPPMGQPDAATMERLALDEPLLTNYVVTAEDVERLIPLSGTWLGKSQQPRLDFETVLELVAEKTFSHPNFVRRLNPSVDWNTVTAGTVLTVLSISPPAAEEKAAFVEIRLGERILRAFGAESNLLAHFPCSIAQKVEKRPVGEQLEVVTVAPRPNYTLDPAVFPESAEARELGRKLVLQPGPNNPVGAVWIGLDKPGYGIHGTPRPEDVGRTESHGCFRLANWNAEHLLKLIRVGTPVYVQP